MGSSSCPASPWPPVFHWHSLAGACLPLALFGRSRPCRSQKALGGCSPLGLQQPKSLKPVCPKKELCTGSNCHGTAVQKSLKPGGPKKEELCTGSARAAA